MPHHCLYDLRVTSMQGRLVYRGDLGDALPTGRKRIFIFFNSITAKVVFSVLDLLSVIVQSESSDSSRVSMVPPLFGQIHRRGKSPKPSPLTLMLKLFFPEIEPSMHFQWGFGTRPNVLASYVTEQRARRDIFDQVTC